MRTTVALRLLFLPFLFPFLLGAQTVKRWTLQECIHYALQNNLQIGQNNLQVQQSRASLLQAKGAVLPSINGSANHTYNMGRRIDPFTNQFASDVVLSQNFSVSSNMNLFSGLTNTHTILGNRLAVIAAEQGNAQLKNDVALSVANAFLQVVLAGELQAIAENQLNIIREQRDRAKLLYEAGRTARGDFLQVEAQMATEELNVVRARNNRELALLTLAQLLALESAEDFEIEKPDFSKTPIELPIYNARDVYVTALEQYPGVVSADYNLRSQARMLKAARGAYFPALNVFGGLGTGYSELSRTMVGTVTQQQYIGDIQGQPIILDVQAPLLDRTPYIDQMSQNFNRVVGLSLNIPIFNNFRTRTQVSFQKIAVENARLQHQIAKNNLRRDVQTAWFDAKAAYERYKATEKSVQALGEAFEYIRQRFDIGLVNSFEYNTSKNQLAEAQSNLAQARYEFILRSKVLDFYQGKPITF